MPQFNEYTDKTELSDSDISVLYDASSRTTKRFSFLNISRYVLAKLSTRLFTNLSTEDKTIPGAINEVNTKAAKIDDFENVIAEKANKEDIPTTLSELASDSEHNTVTAAEKEIWNKKSDFSGSYNDLTDKPEIHGVTVDETLDETSENPVQNKAVYAEFQKKAGKNDIPKSLSALAADENHRTVTDTEKENWNAKSDFSGDYSELSNKPKIPEKLADLAEDETHRTVTDSEKGAWDAKSNFSGNYSDLSGVPAIPEKLPNPNKLTFSGAVTAEYDGSGAVTVEIPEENDYRVARIEKGTTDSTVELEPNKLYIFPEMGSLTYTLAVPNDSAVANEYHFVFKSGATATRVVHPAGVNIGSFSVESNKIYEVSILEDLLTSQSWAVS